MPKKFSFSKLLLPLITLVGFFFIVLLFVPDSWLEEGNTTQEEQSENIKRDENEEERSHEKPEQRSIEIDYGDTTEYQEIKEKYQKIGLLEGILASLSEFIELPNELTAEYSECGEENAFYDPEAQKITLCYEIIEWAESVSSEGENPDEVAQNILTFFSLHEIGHALIDLYELPITGREEDVADQIATFFLLGTNDTGVLDTADSFYTDLSWLEANELPFSDEHSLDHQRYYNILCWVYGSDMENYQYLVDEEFIPADRAEICEQEYITMNNSFLTLLEPYIKNSL
jgi:hypothetical protein